MSESDTKNKSKWNIESEDWKNGHEKKMKKVWPKFKKSIDNTITESN